MNLKQFGQRYITLIFLFGQSPFYPRYHRSSIRSGIGSELKKKEPNHLFQFVHLIPCIIYVIYLIFIITICINVITRKISFSYGVYSFFVLCKVVTCVMVLKCSPLCSNSLKKLWHQFEQLEQYARTVVKDEWLWRECERKYLQKSLLVMVTFMSRPIAKFFARGELFSLNKTFLTYSLVFISNITILHILFYVHLMNFILEMINWSLSNSFKCGNNGVFKVNSGAHIDKKLLADIDVIKRFHYKLWQICKLINLNFGWIMVLLVLQKMSNTLNAIYWIIIDFYEDDVGENLQVLSMLFIK